MFEKISITLEIKIVLRIRHMSKELLITVHLVSVLNVFYGPGTL